jgi:ribose-phosphate pyrophosphokinase
MTPGASNLDHQWRQDMLLFAPLHTRSFGARVAQHLGMELAASEEREHDGGEHKMRAHQDVRNQDVFVIQSLNGDAHASANDKLCRLLFFIAALRDAGAARITACVPYLCYARKDRRSTAQDAVTLRYVAQMFEALGTARLVVLDVHNEAAFDNAFRCSTLRLAADAVLLDHLGQRCELQTMMVAAPDIGGVKRAQWLQAVLAERLGSNVDFAFMEKRRSGDTLFGEQLVGDVAGRDLLIYDDMIASGATIARATQAARNAGARSVHIAATHAAFTGEIAQLAGRDGPDSVLVTDSIQLPEHLAALLAPRLTICSVAPLFAAAIRSLGNCG